MEDDRFKQIRESVMYAAGRMFPGTLRFNGDQLRAAAERIVPDYLHYEIIETMGGETFFVITLEESHP
jgi:hypothetical protein